MKITVNENPNTDETEITISCRCITPETERIVAALHILDRQITGIKNGELHIVEVSEIMYAESVDRKTFIYTRGDCFESRLRLYEIEQQLCECGFARVGKACLVNIKYIRSLKREMDRKLLVTLESGEKIIASRQYADELKKRLGVKV